MGTWDSGILDNDSASDGLGDLAHGISGDIERLGATAPSATSTARLGAAVGVLLQLSPYDFTDESGARIVAALRAHSSSIESFPPEFQQVLQRVIAGEGEALAQRPGDLPIAQGKLLHAESNRSRFGERQAALFASGPAAAYVQEVADRCVDMVDADFEDESNWSDLCREASGLGGLAALLVLQPCSVPTQKIADWRRMAQQGLATLEAQDDEELSFQRQYHANLDRVFAALLARFAG